MLADKAITAPPEGAGLLRVKDNVALDPLVTVLGLIENPVSVGRPGIVPVTVTLAVWLPPLYVAVTIAVVVDVIAVLDCTEKLALAWPAGTV